MLKLTTHIITKRHLIKFRELYIYIAVFQNIKHCRKKHHDRNFKNHKRPLNSTLGWTSVWHWSQTNSWCRGCGLYKMWYFFAPSSGQIGSNIFAHDFQLLCLYENVIKLLILLLQLLLLLLLNTTTNKCLYDWKIENLHSYSFPKNLHFYHLLIILQ